MLAAVAISGSKGAMAASPIGRRAVITAASTISTAMSAADSAVATEYPPLRFEHSLTSVDVGDVNIPVAIWRPVDQLAASAIPPPPYPYSIDIGKIAAKLRVGFLSWLPSFDYKLPCGAAEVRSLPAGFSSARRGDCLLFAHGFLGSVYDFAHAAEALAADGFTVVAPELPESLSASYKPTEGLSRDEILAAARALLDDEAAPGVQRRRWGIFGHSAGAGSALLQRGDFTLGRACLATGFRQGYAGQDPLFLCASEGDGCTRFMQTDLRSALLADATACTFFDSLDEAYASPASAPPHRGCFIFTAENSPSPLPCHISFLWREVDDAMASLLSPLLPLAKALGLFLLDFDVYLETRDAEQTAQLVVPALRRFFLSSSSR